MSFSTRAAWEGKDGVGSSNHILSIRGVSFIRGTALQSQKHICT